MVIPFITISDGMGSVIGLANGAGAEVGDFRYDSFGNVREEWGGAIGSTGGDFRFQGQWLEEGTGIYHFRARDYDAQTGTFLSRDPIDPTEQQPEAMNPYQFAYGNPYIYSDPSGMFTLVEINAGQSIQGILDKVESFVASQVKDYLVDKARGVVGELIAPFLSSVLPGSQAYINAGWAVSRFEPGNRFEQFVQDSLCELLGDSSYLNNLYLETQVSTTGTPLSDGFNCGDSIPSRADFLRNEYRVNREVPNRPDYIIREGAPRSTDYSLTRGQGKKSWLIGDFKYSLTTVRNKIVNNSTQWQAMASYAKYQNQHEYAPIISYITLSSGNQRTRDVFVREMEGEAAEKGVVLLIASLK